MSAVRCGGATKAASVVLQRKELMHHPGLPDLFEAVVVVRAAAHAIEILRNDGMICLRQAKPIRLDVAVIANVRSHHQADLGSVAASLDQAGQISHDDIRSRREGAFRNALRRGVSREAGARTETAGA